MDTWSTAYLARERIEELRARARSDRAARRLRAARRGRADGGPGRIARALAAWRPVREAAARIMAAADPETTPGSRRRAPELSRRIGAPSV
ncbi:hypothetical protein [Allonocardiopsis opalescens]|uniref:Uncharacterized protein n=1 Tax=Allonocardiopsis opalescens TaxID=1144618 RepID=A0A2T0QFJ7_9ACTN|nr:hypothetical protein [Allonocardiopsis opalescens]PRY02623.1 hypothetical protein CLV72_1011226 [Allonocardiopsis opalescens]